MSKFRDSFIAGILVLAPLGAVFWILAWIWDLLHHLASIVPSSLDPKALLNIENPLVATAVDVVLTIILLGLFLFFICAIGMVSRNYLGHQLLEFIRSTVSRVPVLSTIYSTLEQLLKTFAAGKSKSFRRVVQIEYPRKGIYTLAFVTSERPNGLITVYVPTTPNPTSGFYLILPSSEARELDTPVEEALKEVISMGLVYSQSTKE